MSGVGASVVGGRARREAEVWWKQLSQPAVELATLHRFREWERRRPSNRRAWTQVAAERCPRGAI